VPRDEGVFDPVERDGAVEVASEYSFGDRGLHDLMRDGEAWFVAAEVCAVLEHSDPSKAVSRLDPEADVHHQRERSPRPCSQVSEAAGESVQPVGEGDGSAVLAPNRDGAGDPG